MVIVPERIVSISQPYIRPIVRGKAKTPTEFEAKIDLSIDDNGMARIEKQSFDAYNESDVLIGAIERHYKRTGHYPERVPAITSTGTAGTLGTAESTESVCPVLHLGGRKRIHQRTKTLSTQMLLTA